MRSRESQKLFARWFADARSMACRSTRPADATRCSCSSPRARRAYPKMALHDYTYALGHYVTAKYWHLVEPDGLHFTISETGWGKAHWGTRRRRAKRLGGAGPGARPGRQGDDPPREGHRADGRAEEGRAPEDHQRQDPAQQAVRIMRLCGRAESMTPPRVEAYPPNEVSCEAGAKRGVSHRFKKLSRFANYRNRLNLKR